MSNILDRRFKYTNAASTDIRKRFEAIDPNWNKNPRKVRRKKPAPSATVTPIKAVK